MGSPYEHIKLIAPTSDLSDGDLLQLARMALRDSMLLTNERTARRLHKQERDIGYLDFSTEPHTTNDTTYTTASSTWIQIDEQPPRSIERFLVACAAVITGVVIVLTGLTVSGAIR